MAMQPNQTPGAVIWRHEGSLATTGHLLSREQVFDGGDVSTVTPFVAQHLPRRPCRSLAWCPPDRAGIFWVSSFCLFWFMFHSLQPAKAGLLTIAEVAQGAAAQMQHKVPNARSAVSALLHARHACEAYHTGTFTAQAHPPPCTLPSFSTPLRLRDLKVSATQRPTPCHSSQAQ